MHTPITGGSGNGSRTPLPTACSAFNDYPLLWTADQIAIGVNGSVCHRHRKPRTGRAAWPFDAPQHLLPNVAIGGTPGGAAGDSIFPRTMEIEHVRIWQAPPQDLRLTTRRRCDHSSINDEAKRCARTA